MAFLMHSSPRLLLSWKQGWVSQQSVCVLKVSFILCTIEAIKLLDFSFRSVICDGEHTALLFPE